MKKQLKQKQTNKKIIIAGTTAILTLVLGANYVSKNFSNEEVKTTTNETLNIYAQPFEQEEAYNGQYKKNMNFDSSKNLDESNVIKGEIKIGLQEFNKDFVNTMEKNSRILDDLAEGEISKIPGVDQVEEVNRETKNFYDNVVNGSKDPSVSFDGNNWSDWSIDPLQGLEGHSYNVWEQAKTYGVLPDVDGFEIAVDANVESFKMESLGEFKIDSSKYHISNIAYITPDGWSDIVASGGIDIPEITFRFKEVSFRMPSIPEGANIYDLLGINSSRWTTEFTLSEANQIIVDALTNLIGERPTDIIGGSAWDVAYGSITSVADKFDDELMNLLNGAESVLASVDGEIINIKTLFDTINGIIDSWNEAIVNLNTKIVSLNDKLNELELAINNVLASGAVDSFESLNKLIDDFNVLINNVNDEIDAQIIVLQAAIDREVGEYNNVVNFINDTFEYLVKDIAWTAMYIHVSSLIEAPAIDGKPFNMYQDSTYRIDDDLIGDWNATNSDDVDSWNLVKHPFIEKEVDGATIGIGTEPMFEQVASDKYDLVYNVWVREDKEYASFDEIANKIKVYDQDGNLLESEFVSVEGSESNIEYDEVEYSFKIKNLEAGKEYNFFMQPFSDEEGGKENPLVDGFNKAVRVNVKPVVHYMENTISENSVELKPTEATAKINVKDGGNYWDIEEDDIEVKTHLVESGAEIATTMSYTNGTTGEGMLDLSANTLTPNTNYVTDISIRRWDSDDSTWITTNDEERIEFALTWSTPDWLAPKEPVITLGDNGVDGLADPKHSRSFNAKMTIPSSDVSIGEDTTKVTKVELLGKKEDDVEFKTWTSKDIDKVGGASEVVEDVSEFIQTGLELGTKYDSKLRVTYEGVNLGVASQDFVESNIVSFETEGLNPAIAPEKPVLTIKESSTTSNSITVGYHFEDPATLADTEDTIISSANLMYREKGLVSKGDWMSGGSADISGAVVGNTTSTSFDGEIVIEGLNPNTNYEFQMNLNSNVVDDKDEPIVVSSDIVEEKTLKADALLPEWKTLEVSEELSDQAILNFEFNIPQPNGKNKDTILDEMVIYGKEVASKDEEFKVDENGKLIGSTELVSGTNYVVAYEDGFGLDNPEGNVKGTITLLDLAPTHIYQIQGGLRSHDTGEDGINGNEDDSALSEVYDGKDVVVETGKAAAIGPWYDEDTESETYGGISEVTSETYEDDSGEMKANAQFTYKLYVPLEDEEHYDTIFDIINNTNLRISKIDKNEDGEEIEGTELLWTNEILGSSGFESGTFEMIQENEGTITDVTHTCEDGTMLTQAYEYSGKIIANDLDLGTTYNLKMTSGFKTEDADAGTPERVISNTQRFETEKMNALPPYWGLESNEDDGLIQSETIPSTADSITYDFDFTLPQETEENQETELKEVHFYVPMDSMKRFPDAIIDGLQYEEIVYVIGEDVPSEIALGEDIKIENGHYTGSFTIKGFNEPGKEYKVYVGLETNAIVKGDEDFIDPEFDDAPIDNIVLSPGVIAKTATGDASEPIIKNAKIKYNKEEERYKLSLDIDTNNGLHDLGNHYADALIESISVGNVAKDEEGNMLDVDGNVVDNWEEANVDTFEIDDQNKYLNEVKVFESEEYDNGKGKDSVHYDFDLKANYNYWSFNKQIDDIIILVDWKDDGSAPVEQEGTIKYKMPILKTPKLETVKPEFNNEAIIVKDAEDGQAKLHYQVNLYKSGLLGENQLQEGGLYEYQSFTKIDRVVVKDKNVGPRNSKGIFGDKDEPTLREGYYYDSEISSSYPADAYGNFTPDGEREDFGKFDEETGILYGDILLSNLETGKTYRDLVIEAEWNAYDHGERPDDYGDKINGEGGVISTEVPEFLVEPENWIGPITPGLDPDDKPVVELPIEPPGVGEGNHNPDGGWPEVDPIEPEKPEVIDPSGGDEDDERKSVIPIIAIFFVSGLILVAILYPLLKRID